VENTSEDGGGYFEVDLKVMLILNPKLCHRI